MSDKNKVIDLSFSSTGPLDAKYTKWKSNDVTFGADEAIFDKDSSALYVDSYSGPYNSLFEEVTKNHHFRFTLKLDSSRTTHYLFYTYDMQLYITKSDSKWLLKTKMKDGTVNLGESSFDVTPIMDGEYHILDIYTEVQAPNGSVTAKDTLYAVIDDNTSSPIHFEGYPTVSVSYDVSEPAFIFRDTEYKWTGFNPDGYSKTPNKDMALTLGTDKHSNPFVSKDSTKTLKGSIKKVEVWINSYATGRLLESANLVSNIRVVGGKLTNYGNTGGALNIDPLLLDRLKIITTESGAPGGQCFQFPNKVVGNTVTFTFPSLLNNFLNDVWTFSFWMSTNKKFMFRIFDLHLIDTMYVIDPDDKTINFNISDLKSGTNADNSIDIGSSIKDVWNFYMITYDPFTTRIYVNGVKKFETTMHYGYQQGYPSKFFIEMGGKAAKVQELGCIKGQIMEKKDFTPPTSFYIKSSEFIGAESQALK